MSLETLPYIYIYMEVFQGTSSKVSKFAPEEDVISSIQDNVITNIMDRLPIQDAVKTGVLSKNWRFKWTLLTQLVFDDKFFKYFLRPHVTNDYNGRDISRLLLHLKGPVTKFVLYIPDYQVLDVKDIYHWVLFVSRKGIKELTIVNKSIGTPLFKFPSHIFSCVELKHLKLERCCISPMSSLRGFPNLLSLDLYMVTFGIYKCVEFITRCPLLEMLKIGCCEPIGEWELKKIAKLVNLRTIYLKLTMVDSMKMITSFSIFELMGLLPKLQELALRFYNFKFLAEASVKKVPTAFLCLKTLTLSEVDFSNDMMLSFVFEMICGSPNLQTFRMMARYKDDILPPALSSSNFHYSAMGQLQLRRVVFAGFRGSENEVCLIKSLLACSPLLKKISIGLSSTSMVGGADGKFVFANKLLKLYRSSPMVEIDLN